MPENFVSRLKWPLSYIFAVLVLSYAFTAYALLAPDGLKHFNFIMFIPASCAIVWRLVQKRSIGSLFDPLVRAPTLKSVAFALLYPVGVILLCALIAQITGLAAVNWSVLPSAIHLFSVYQF